jgi:hypothetical protein
MACYVTYKDTAVHDSDYINVWSNNVPEIDLHSDYKQAYYPMGAKN